MPGNIEFRPPSFGDAWPEEELEHLGKCPVCSSRERDRLYADLTDTVFRCAPGKWTLWKCRRCGCGYLDPRPDERSIWMAYANYFTHEPVVGKTWTGLRRFLHALRVVATNDYLNNRYGHDLRPVLPIGRWIGRLNPHHGWPADFSIRHLPAPAAAGEKLLDVGCGNGGFLAVADRLGYDAVGLEPDEAAVNAAKSKGGNVIQGSLPSPALRHGSFAQVTMSHVLEHLRDPLAALREIHALLRPGGRVWLTTPNIDSTLSQAFRRHWRGLEPPRHLVLFTPNALKKTLQTVGFADAEILPPGPADWFALVSFGLMTGHEPQRVRDLPSEWRDVARRADKAALKDVTQGETITMVGYKRP